MRSIARCWNCESTLGKRNMELTPQIATLYTAVHPYIRHVLKAWSNSFFFPLHNMMLATMDVDGTLKIVGWIMLWSPSLLGKTC